MMMYFISLSDLIRCWGRGTCGCAGADVNHRNYLGSSALVLAAKNQQLPLVEMLLEAGAHPSAREREHGLSAFALACKHGFAKVGLAGLGFPCDKGESCPCARVRSLARL